MLVGGPSGRSERADPDRMRELAAKLGITGIVLLEPPCPQAELADWYRAATVVLTPSHSESFGLVALGGPGLRHARGGGQRGRAAHGRQGRLLGCPGAQPRPGGLGAGDQAAGADAAAAARTFQGRAAARLHFRLVRDSRPAGHGVYRCNGRDSSTGQGVTGHGNARRPRGRARQARPGVHPARARCLPGPPGWRAQARHDDLADRRGPQPPGGGVLLPSAPTRTTPPSTASCSSATGGCMACTSRWTAPATST